jgi:polyphosphate glucokinase
VKTLVIDVGGAGIKGVVLDAKGEMLVEKIRAPTPYPCPPSVLLVKLADVAAALPRADRATVGFPGLVHNGRVANVPALSRQVRGGAVDEILAAEWDGFDLQTAVDGLLGVPSKVANDADIQGSAVVTGKGYEFVLTLGTGAGTALFLDGVLQTHMELGHAPFRDGCTFEECIGDSAREKVGDQAWAGVVIEALAAYQSFLFFDHAYVGGGNSKVLRALDPPFTARLPSSLVGKVTLISNTAGLLGGITLWR